MRANRPRIPARYHGGLPLRGLLCAVIVWSGTATAADREIDGDLTAPALCAGDGCVAGDPVTPDLRLQSAVVRVRLIDTSAINKDETGLGDSWSLIANDYTGANDPEPYFSFALRSIDPTPDDSHNNIVAEHMLRFGPADRNAVAVGGDSAFTDDAVTVGHERLQRRLVHVASAIEDTDLLNKGQLDADLLGTVGDLTAMLDDLEAEVRRLERQAAVDNGDGGSGGSSGGGGGVPGMPLLILLTALAASRTAARTMPHDRSGPANGATTR